MIIAERIGPMVFSNRCDTIGKVSKIFKHERKRGDRKGEQNDDDLQ